MVFLSALLAISASGILYLGYPFLFAFLKKIPHPHKETFFPRLWSFCLSTAITLLFALIILLAYGGYDFWNAFAFLLLISGAFDFIDPIRLIKKLVETENFRDRHLFFSCTLVIYILLEAFAFNARAYKSNRETTFIDDLVSSSLISNVSSINTDEETGDFTLITGGKSTFSVTISEDSKADNILFGYDASRSTLITVKAEYLSSDGTYVQYGSYATNPKTPDYNQIPLERYEGVTVYRFTFTLDTGRTDNPSEVALNSITLDAPVYFSFSCLRGIAVVSIAFTICYFGYFFTRKKEQEFSKKPYIVVASTGGIAMIILFIVSWCFPNEFYTSWSYIQENANTSYQLSIYHELFYAFQNGKFSLSIPVSDALREAEEAGINVYDRTWRSTNGISAVWDHAYYHGNYYCYYGVFPLLFVMYPIFWLTGGNYVPNHLLCNWIGLILVIPTLIILILELYRFVSKKIHYPTFVVLALLSVFLAMSFNNVTFKDASFFEGIYHMPIVYGLVNMDLFLIFLLVAYRKKEKRIIYFSFTGLFFVFLMMSRPSLALVLLIAAPLYIKMLIDKEIPIKKRLISLIPMIVILAIGGAFVCYYNYARFENIFEFGQSYQINYDQTNLTYGWDKVFPTIIHFYFQYPAFYDKFPFISCSVFRLNFDNVPYCQGYYGMMLIPFFILSFVPPFMLWKKDKTQFAFSLMIPIMVFGVAFTCYSKAGICPRYLIEPYHLSTLGGVLASILIINYFREKSPNSNVAPAVIYGVALISAFLCLNLAMDTFDGINAGDMDGLLLRLKEVFGYHHYR